MPTFEWDDAKNKSNLAKHGITFSAATKVFDDPAHILLLDRVVEGEVRWHAVGFVRDSLLVVVHTYPDEGNDHLIRIVSARRATQLEEQTYDAQNS